jgi:glyoxylase-like metal-dependent hydrolase (beta-lactamase superfamily II)
MTGKGTNTYIVGISQLVVVDPGPDLPEHVDAIIAVAEENGGRIVGQLLTHGHSDHLAAAPLLRQRVGAPIYGHRDLPGVDHVLANGDELVLGDATFRTYDTPGHADDHLCFWLASERTLFAGDLLAGTGTVVLSRTPGSLTRYLASLERMRDLGSLTIMPGHGPVVRDGRARIGEYIEHRNTRERQIVDALLAGPATVDEMVRRIYVTTPRQLYAMAVRNVQAHLEHLEGQGRVSFDGTTWQLASRQGP